MDLIYSTNYNPAPNFLSITDTIKPLVLNRVKNPTISFFSGNSTNNYYGRTFLEHEYDLYEYGRIMDTEALVARAFQKKKTLIFKEGYRFYSKNEENLQYVKKRIAEISYMSKKSFRLFLREIANNLIIFHNAYIVKVRKEDASSGKKRVFKDGIELEPVAAYFNVAPETMQPKIDESGTPRRFRQYLSNGRFREFPDHNVMHLAYNKRTGFTMGTPPLEAVKDDILALRRIEESIETLIYKSLFPIIHVKVGSDKAPARTLPSGISEVDAATSYLRNIEDNGGVVTSERVDISAIGAESLALRAESYLDHFKKRVYAGLGMSGIDFGDGDATGRATGEVLSSALRDSVVDYQIELEEFITTEIIDELLLESGKYEHSYQIPEEERVYVSFTDIGIEDLMKRESHTLNKMTQGLITHNEAREEVGKKPLTPEQIKEMHEYRKQEAMDGLEVKKQKDLESHKADENIRVSKAAPKPAAASGSKPPSKGTAKPSGGKPKPKGSSNLTKSIVKPKNQHTKDSVKKLLVDNILLYKNINLFSLKANKVLADYAMSTISFGLLDASDFIDPEIEKHINNTIADIIEDISNSDMNSIKINTIVNKRIDNLSIYVNNIICE